MERVREGALGALISLLLRVGSIVRYIPMSLEHAMTIATRALNAESHEIPRNFSWDEKSAQSRARLDVWAYHLT